MFIVSLKFSRASLSSVGQPWQEQQHTEWLRVKVQHPCGSASPAGAVRVPAPSTGC